MREAFRASAVPTRIRTGAHRRCQRPAHRYREEEPNGGYAGRSSVMVMGLFLGLAFTAETSINWRAYPQIRHRRRRSRITADA
jgi:hypothetical protein